jgi:hypothetical protein
MLTVNPVKSLQGKFDLPSSQDLFLLAVVTAVASNQPVVIKPIKISPLLNHWCDEFSRLASFQFDSGSCTVKPISSEDATSFLMLDYDYLPYKDLIIFILLGIGKTVAFRSVSQKRIDVICETIRRYGADCEVKTFDGNPGITLSKPPSISETFKVEERDISPLMGLYLGTRSAFTLQTTFPFANPLRHLAPVFGYEISFKSAVPRENDPFARRLKMLQSATSNNQGQKFNLTCDFSHPKTSEELIEISLPGDEILSTVMLSAKCLFPKGSFVISNMPLETWAAPALSFIRKMGCKVSVQETHRTSFGSAGMFSVQKCDLVGRKVECNPSSLYSVHLPAMTVLAAFAKGQSVFRNLQDLRNDEPDGIDQLETCIRTLGARHGEMPDGIVMDGGKDFDGFDLAGNIPAHIAASFAIAGLKCMGTTTIEDETLKMRWPDFESYLSQLYDLRS